MADAAIPQSESDPSAAQPSNMVAVNYEHSPHLIDILERANITLLVSTYQAGKLFTVGTHAGGLAFNFYHFEQAMGVAASASKIAVGAKRQIWFLKSAPDLAGQVEPRGKYDACYLSRSCHYSGAIHCHEMCWAGDELWVVNTLFSCLCTIHPEFSFVPRWRPPFITSLAAEDRCHLNGLCMHEGKPRYVTAMAEVDTAAGWRPNKASTGLIIDVATNQIVARGFAMPHSPRLYDGRLWVLDSGHGRLSLVDPATGKVQPVTHVSGYARGLAFHGPFAFVGMSLIRETAVFGGVPIAEKRDRLQCGVAVIDIRSGRQIAGLVFHSGVQEIFDVQILFGVRCPILSGPLPDLDNQQTIWLAPSG